jgi:trimeric autotransporter adhesin
MKYLIYSLIFLFTMFPTRIFPQFAGGSGTAEDPWLIRTAQNLDSLRYYLGSGNTDNYFKQIADINLGVAPWNEGAGWEPIGRDSTFADVFKASFNGNGFRIMNLFINRSDEDYIGLFGILYDSAEIKEVFLENASVIGRNKVGGFIGLTDYLVDVSKCAVTGIIQGINEVGGLIGESKSVYLINSYNSASISGTKNIGGLIGKAVPEVWNVIHKSYSNGSVSGSENKGGLFGYSEDINVLSCYWDTETSGQTESAGGEGRTTDEMTNEFSSDTFEYWDFRNIWTEDFQNVNKGYPFLTNRLSPLAPGAPSNLTSTCRNGGFSVEISWNNPDTLNNGEPITNLTTIHLYRNFDLIYTLDSPTPGGLSGYSDIAPQTGNYTYKVIGINSEGFGINARIDQPAGNLFAGGTGTNSDPYLVSNAEQLNNVRFYTMKDSICFRQIAQIDLGVAPWNEGAGWEPIGHHENEFMGKFSGTGDDSSCRISGLTINDPAQNYSSLFGVIRDAVINNVHLIHVDISGNAACGALTGASINSKITECSAVLGSVIGNENEIGGLIGNSIADSVLYCYSIINTEGKDHVGGLTGLLFNNAVVSDCYSMGNVTANSHAGGLIGVNDESFIVNSYSIGLVTGTSYLGGLVGSSSSGSVINSYWDIETSGQISSAGGEGRTTIEMQIPHNDSTYVGWDFENIWIEAMIVDYGNYPYLRWQNLTGIEENNTTLPETFTLYQNYPNPFNPVTKINFSLAKTAEVKLSVYNIAGQIAAELISGVKNAGFHTFDFDGSKLTSGVFYYTLEVDGKKLTKKMLMVK